MGDTILRLMKYYHRTQDAVESMLAGLEADVTAMGRDYQVYMQWCRDAGERLGLDPKSLTEEGYASSVRTKDEAR